MISWLSLLHRPYEDRVAKNCDNVHPKLKSSSPREVSKASNSLESLVLSIRTDHVLFCTVFHHSCLLAENVFFPTVHGSNGYDWLLNNGQSTY
ncbi:hypothetical protein HBH56_027780 [Parastagonospora nodorum]|nr:hypothetical protein HBH56_027780 [Parastagonospora nodorum]KAH3934356.1 hypothetical protein HBH54_054270 [Parastagonospora nodorum]KAH3975981.1 hypothetical protein HBH51_083410 [Parastagonospora nodorum]KAH4039083.1 hypothetical protein HBI09_043670 [Parastagonospora nodorum]KAH4054858.1 hypothetical protein HBH49_068210 [Parastagonospora nodorum]